MRTLLILDLDETLVHPRLEPLPEREDGFLATGWHVYSRPGLSAFLEWCLGRFAVAIWTSAEIDYARAVVARIMKDEPEFLWTKSECMPRLDGQTSEVVWSKPLQPVLDMGWPVERVVWLDNSPEKFAEYPDNGIWVPDFTGARDDYVLECLGDCLERCAAADDVRTVDKDW